jgi:hypothetical protein
MVRLALAVAILGAAARVVAVEPYPGWYPQYWLDRQGGVELLWDPWPDAEQIRALGDAELFDFPPMPDDGQGMIHRNGYVEIVTEDGEMGWIPATSRIALSCGRPGYRARPNGH